MSVVPPDVLYAAGAAAFISIFVAATDKYLLSRLPVKAFIFLIGVLGIFTVILVPITQSEPLTTHAWMIGSITGVLLALIIFFAFQAIRQEEISRLAPLSTLSTIMIIVGGIIFFGEPVTKSRIVGFGFLGVGAFLLSTRFVKQIEMLEPEFYPKLLRKAQWHVIQTIQDPYHHSLRVGKNFRRAANSAASQMATQVAKVAALQNMLILRTKTKVKLVKGWKWYLAAIILSVPYSLLFKYHANLYGTVNSFVSVRVSMGIVLVAIALTSYREIMVLWRKPFVTLIALVKEPFGIATGFLIAYALAHGDLSVVRSITSLEAAGIFLLSVSLAKIGIIPESLRKRDLIQKGAGALCMVIGSILIFL